MKPLTILVDCDINCFQACAAAQQDVQWNEDIVSVWTDLSDAKKIFHDKLDDTVKRVLHFTKHKGDYKLIMAFSDKQNFRKLIYPQYKGNRVGKRKPCGYSQLKEYIMKNYEHIILPMLEADDVLGVYSGILENVVRVSEDKDLRSIPGMLYNPRKDVLEEITPEIADYANMYQCLIGDSTDFYPGLEGCGPKTAEKILATEQSWKAVESAYLAKGKTVDDMILMARVARILRATDYDVSTGTIHLWSPNGTAVSLRPSNRLGSESTEHHATSVAETKEEQ